MKRIGLILLAVVVTFSLAVPASADLLGDKTAALLKLRKQIEEQQKKLDAVRKQKVTLKSQIEILEEQIKASELQLEAIGQQIDLTNDNLSQINADLVDSEVKIYESKRALREAIKEAYMRNRLGMVEVVLGSDDLSGFISQLEYVSTVEGRITNSLSVLKQLGESLKQKKGDLEVADKQLKDLQANKEVEQNSLNVQSDAKERLLKDATLTEAEYEKKIQDAVIEQQKLDSEIAALTKRSRKEPLSPGGVKLMWPIAARKVSANFHDADYFARFKIPHNAIDVPTPQGTPIKAPADAYVSKVRFPGDTSYSYIALDHGSSIVTVYGHVSGVNVVAGQFVKAGTVIGYTGATPGSIGAGWLTTGPHLHFEVWVGGVARNPLDYLVG